MGNLTYSKGISWIDDCRIPHNEACKEMKKQDVINSIYGQGGRHADVLELKPQGRFPANILVSDDMLNDGVISKSTGGIPNGKSVYGRNSFNESSTINTQDKVGFGDKGTNSRYYDIDKWFEKLLDV
jgi:hypothetical protein